MHEQIEPRRNIHKLDGFGSDFPYRQHFNFPIADYTFRNNMMTDMRKRKSRLSSRSDDGQQFGAMAKMRRNGSRILSLVGWQRNSGKKILHRG